MKAYALLPWILGSALFLPAQGVDSIPDVRLPGNPAWFGTLPYFYSIEDTLVLDDPGYRTGGLAWLGRYAPIEAGRPARWRLRVRLDFSPSPANHLRVHLLSDHPDPQRARRSYLLMVGGVAGDRDALCLYYQEGTDRRLVLEGEPGRAGGGSVDVLIELLRSTDGHWTLLTSYRPGDPPAPEARSAVPGPVADGPYLAITCRYTRSRARAMAISDLAYGPVGPPHRPAAWVGPEPISADSLALRAEVPVGANTPGGGLDLRGTEAGIRAVVRDEADPRRLIITTTRPLDDGAAYQLASSGLRDIVGRPFPDTTLAFTHYVPRPPRPGDLRINEVLFDPPHDGHDYLELINVSNSSLALAGLRVLGPGAGGAALGPDAAPLPPRAYLVLTGGPEWLAAAYDSVNPEAARRFDLPALPRAAGEVRLMARGEEIDALAYDEGMHSPWLARTAGVALERVDPRGVTQSAENWHSAASTTGFGTPTRRNSQWFGAEPASDALHLARRVFSPDGDGHDDFLPLRVRPGTPDGLFSLRVFDEYGRPVRVLAQNGTAGSGAALRWDGANDAGQRQRQGIYLLVLEVLDPAGRTRVYRDYCVLAGH